MRSCRRWSIRSRRWLPDAPLLREDIKDKTDGAHGPRKHHNHIFTWGVGDKAGTDAAFAGAPVTVKELISYQRFHPCSDGDLRLGRLDGQDQGRADACGAPSRRRMWCAPWPR